MLVTTESDYTTMMVELQHRRSRAYNHDTSCHDGYEHGAPRPPAPVPRPGRPTPGGPDGPWEGAEMGRNRAEIGPKSGQF